MLKGQLYIFRYRFTDGEDIDVAVVTDSAAWRASDILAEAELIKMGRGVGQVVRASRCSLSEIFRDW